MAISLKLLLFCELILVILYELYSTNLKEMSLMETTVAVCDYESLARQFHNFISMNEFTKQVETVGELN